MNKLSVFMLVFLITGFANLAFAAGNPTGETIQGDKVTGKKSKMDCEKAAKIEAAKEAIRTCEIFCSPQAIDDVNVDRDSAVATCNSNGKRYEGAATIKLSRCTCTDFTVTPTEDHTNMNNDPIFF